MTVRVRHAGDGLIGASIDGARWFYMTRDEASELVAAVTQLVKLEEPSPHLEVLELRARQIHKALDRACQVVPGGCRMVVILESEKSCVYSSSIPRDQAAAIFRGFADRIETGDLL